MNNYERLEDEACKDGVEIVSCDFESDRIHGLYADGVSEWVQSSVQQ